jgi:hypothetical protein
MLEGGDRGCGAICRPSCMMEMLGRQLGWGCEMQCLNHSLYPQDPDRSLNVVSKDGQDHLGSGIGQLVGPFWPGEAAGTLLI